VRTRIVRDSVDTALFTPLPQSAARVRFGIPAEAFVVLFPHEISQPTKRLWLAEAAVSELRNANPAARLWVVNNVRPDDMPWVYAAADVMIVTSAREGGPSSAKEALACGVPVVSVPVGDTQLMEEVPGYAFLADATPSALAHALAESVATRGESRTSRLPAELELSAAARSMEGIYAECLGSP